MIEPFFFDNNRLFGCYHPANNTYSNRLLVICPPFFDEYKRTYKALSELANGCSSKGVHVIRFDYYGTGESGGLLEDANIQGWVNDINTAIEEGISISGADDVVVIGIRFGATLASKITNKNVFRFIYWDPILTGREYADFINKTNEILKNQHITHSKSANIEFENIKYENFAISTKLYNEILKTDLVRPNNAINKHYLITTDYNFFKENRYINCEFSGLNYDWPPFHEGIISLKPVLETLAMKVIEP